METNQHDSGLVEIIDAAESQTLVPASLGTRVGNYFLDLIFTYALLFLIGVMLAAAGINYLETMNEYVLGFLVTCLYYIVFESTSGKTPAKWITRTRVVTIDGSRPSFINIVGRTLCRFIPFDGFSYLFTDGIGWHDTISHTRVIRER